jgi:hypothetical protein
MQTLISLISALIAAAMAVLAPDLLDADGVSAGVEIGYGGAL